VRKCARAEPGTAIPYSPTGRWDFSHLVFGFVRRVAFLREGHQPLISTGEQSGLLTHIAATKSGLLCAPMTAIGANPESERRPLS